MSDAKIETMVMITGREYEALRAENKKLRAALSWIDQQRYTDRDTINPDNAFEKIGKLNGKIIAIMDRARAALTQPTKENPND